MLRECFEECFEDASSIAPWLNNSGEPEASATTREGTSGMRINLRNKDFWSGVMLVVVGAAAGLIARNYPMGTVLRMGSGYFPTILAVLLVGFGIALILRSTRTTEQIDPGWSLRALVLLPIVFAMFGYLLDRAGFIPAMLVIVIGSALTGNEFRPLEILALAAFLTALSVGIFIFGLGLPYQMLVWPPNIGL